MEPLSVFFADILLLSKSKASIGAPTRTEDLSLLRSTDKVLLALNVSLLNTFFLISWTNDLT